MPSEVMERETKSTPAITVLRDRLLQRRSEIEHALDGSGISADRFIRTAITAATYQPELVSDVSFQSLWQALLEACNDRLLPDRRQGVIVPYKGKAKWQPMYRGLIDRFEQSGEYKWIGANLHREDDREFDIWLDENGQHFLHRPGPGKGKVIETYAAAITKSGGFFVSVVNEDEMNRIRSVSRARGDDSPWAQWTDQMRLKSALKRLCKLLPVPHEINELITREDDDDGEAPARPTLASPKPTPRPRGAQAALDQFASDEDWGPEPKQAPAKTEQHDRQTGELPIDPPKQKEDYKGKPVDNSQPVPMVLIDTAYERGKEAKRTGMKRTALPGEYREPGREPEVDAWRKGWDGEPSGGP
jgi:recombination protein RecT